MRKQLHAMWRFLDRCSHFGGCTNVVPDVCSLVTLPVSVGWKRACVTASKPEARVSAGSLKAVPMKLIPIGMPSTSAAGTLMIG